MPSVSPACGDIRRHDEALAESEQAPALDPISPLSLNARATLFFRARHYDEATCASRDALELDPHFTTAFRWQGLSYAAKRDFEKSIACLTQAARCARSAGSDGPSPKVLAWRQPILALRDGTDAVVLK